MINSPDHRTKSDKASAFNVFGRYRLIADVGRGGMSDVYLAVTEGTEAAARFQKLLVIKMLKPELSEDSEFVAMFLNEARLAARLNHPNVVQTIEVGEAGGRYFLAMEYLEGQPLHRVLRNNDARARLGLDMRLHMLIQALAGLHYAHERRDYDGSPLDIVHRDVSPANLFVTYDGHVKLMDFGIAKARDSNSETRVGVFKGKAAYVAPEQARGETVDRRADVYSVGVVLWELLTGRRLWSGLTQIEMLRRVVAGDVITPRSVDPRIPAELEEICMKALAFRREDRYDSAAELATDLEGFAQRSFPPVAGRDIGSVLALAFTEDRDRIRDVIENSLSHHPTPDSSLPALHLTVGETGKSVAPGDSSDENEASLGREVLPITETMSREPVVSSAAAVSGTVPQRNNRLAKALGVAAVLAMSVAAGVAGVSYFMQHQVPALLPASKPAEVMPIERGVSEREIKIGMSAVFSGPSRDLGQSMKLGVETAFQTANEAGGIHGRMLTLTALDDGYEATRAAVTMKDLLEDRSVFAIVGNVGTPTAVVAAPFAAQHKAIFFGAFTGASVLRQDPPERYVFNYRASYKEETAKSIKYLLEVGKLAPEQIVVFAQEDSFGDAGYEGVTKAMRVYGHMGVETLRVGYKRNTADVDPALAALLKYSEETEAGSKGAGESPRVSRHQVKAVVMVATYRAAAKFIQKVRAIPSFSDALFFNVSFVGSESLAEELEGLSPALCKNVYVTQVVPLFDSGATGVRHYRDALAKYQPQAQPGFVSLEGFIVGSIFVEGLKRVGPQLTTEKLVDTLEQIEGLDLGFGSKISFSLSEHQGSHKVWGTQLDETCTYKVVDLD
jgi:serine/threonine protein kinase/ABC-type branched-subunit amino acid transport system substrate-binding protein